MNGWAMLAILFCALFWAAASAFTQSPGTSDGNSGVNGELSGELRDEVYNLEHRLADAELTQDRNFFDNSLADSFIYVAHDGLVLTKPQIVASLHYVDVKRYSIENMKVRQLGPEAVLTTYDLLIRGDIAGRQLPPKQYASSVWVKTADGWKLMFHQSTPARHD